MGIRTTPPVGCTATGRISTTTPRTAQPWVVEERRRRDDVAARKTGSEPDEHLPRVVAPVQAEERVDGVVEAVDHGLAPHE